MLKNGFTPLLTRLPAELLLEDFLPRLQNVITDALRAEKAELRLGATTMLKKLNDRLKAQGVEASHERLFGALGLQSAEGEGGEY